MIYALYMKYFHRSENESLSEDTTLYRVEDMHCSHCEAAVVRAVEEIPGVKSAKANASANTLCVVGSVAEESVRSAVEGIGYTFKGRI